MTTSVAEALLHEAETERDRPRRHLLVAAAIREELAAPIVVVGGAAEDHYTGGVYVETDLDLCGWVREVEKPMLERLGFERRGRHWVHVPSAVAVEFPGARIDGDESRVIEVDVGRGSAAVIGIDDLYLDRIRKATSETPGGTPFKAALALTVADPDAFDWPYVEGVLERTWSVDPLLGREMSRIDREVRARARAALDGA